MVGNWSYVELFKFNYRVRLHTTVPQQALFALNSPFVMEQARALAARPEIVSATKPEQRIEALFCRVLGRHPSKPEISSALRFITSAETRVPAGEGLTAWEQFAQVLLVSNEAVFLD